MRNLFTFFVLLALVSTLRGEPRHALLMGVWDYRDPTFPPLTETGIQADLTGMESKLTALGFTVTVVKNPSLKQAKDAVDAFGRKISEQPGTALFYFTGHGSEYDGKNFLIPAGTAITENGDLDTEALAADRVLARLEKNSRFANIVFIDCCRNSLSKSGGTGMASMEAKGTFIGFATASTKTSQATAGGSYYTNALVKYLGTPGLSITDMHTKVTREVKLQDSTQNPFQYSGLDDLFFFVPASFSKPEPKDMQAEIERRARELAAIMTPKTKPATPGSSTPFTNSLGMKFVPVPDTQVQFCIHETRLSDFAAFVADSPGYDYSSGDEPNTLDSDGWKQRSGFSWNNPGFSQTDDHPVTCVSWEDARAFCQWLSKKEGKTYRLPTDHEWSMAVGTGRRESESTSPESKNLKIEGVYPWGRNFPPIAGAGNYAGREAKNSKWPPDEPTIQDYQDEFARTAPVMSFSANKLGIYDMGGNVWEWCEDWYSAMPECRVLRGGSWDNSSSPDLLSSCRGFDPPAGRDVDRGFRLVLVLGGSGG